MLGPPKQIISSEGVLHYVYASPPGVHVGGPRTAGFYASVVVDTSGTVIRIDEDLDD